VRNITAADAYRLERARSREILLSEQFREMQWQRLSMGKRIVESLKPDTLICWYRDRPESDDPLPNTWTLSRYLLQIHPRPRIEYFWDPAFLQRIVIP